MCIYKYVLYYSVTQTATKAARIVVKVITEVADQAEGSTGRNLTSNAGSKVSGKLR